MARDVFRTCPLEQERTGRDVRSSGQDARATANAKTPGRMLVLGACAAGAGALHLAWAGPLPPKGTGEGTRWAQAHHLARKANGVLWGW
jgi:hypothetical protein